MTTYVAHIVTADAQLGDPEIIVMTHEHEAGGADPVITYPLAADADPYEILHLYGWRTAGTATGEPYEMVPVQPVDWPALITAVTCARAQAQAELDRQDTAWRTVIRDAMSTDGVPRQAIADAAGRSVERVYQIRDGRR